jgi:MFS family permease
VVIAVGAGLTIQFMNLFFFNVFGVDYDVFSLMGAVTSALASIAVLFVPKLKARFGYRGAITATQSGAVLALIGLATTAYYAGAVWALVLAVVLYALRQPLMNMANPMTSELAMYYVGERNREMTSAMTGAVWSGSWFFSAIIFSRLRAADVGYAPIFYITAALYALGVVGFYQLINRYERREAGRSGALRLRAQSAGDGPRPVSGPHGAAERSNAGAQPDAQAGAQGLSGSPGSSSSTTSTERSSIG